MFSLHKRLTTKILLNFHIPNITELFSSNSLDITVYLNMTVITSRVSNKLFVLTLNYETLPNIRSTNMLIFSNRFRWKFDYVSRINTLKPKGWMEIRFHLEMSLYQFLSCIVWSTFILELSKPLEARIFDLQNNSY